MIKMVIVDKWINGCWETDQNLLSESFFFNDHDEACFLMKLVFN